MPSNKTKKGRSDNKETKKRPDGIFTIEELVDSLEPEIKRKLRNSTNKK